jgi:hypothetical protein
VAAWDAFKPDVLIHVHGAPDPLIDQALCRAAREFCWRTRIWRVWCACVETTPGSGVYTITLPAESQAIRLERVTVDGRPLEVIPFTWHELDWEDATNEAAPGVTTDDLSTITVTGQTVSGNIRAQVSLMPTVDSATCPDFVAARYHEAIVAGGARNLLLTRGAPWFDPNAASIQGVIFQELIGRAGVDIARGHTGRFWRPTPNWF